MSHNVTKCHIKKQNETKQDITVKMFPVKQD